MNGGHPMSISPLPFKREDLDNFFKYTERLLASVRAPDHSPFSQDELKNICYLANEIAKLADYQLHLERYSLPEDATSAGPKS
jgi:hypothetical protein